MRVQTAALYCVILPAATVCIKYRLFFYFFFFFIFILLYSPFRFSFSLFSISFLASSFAKRFAYSKYIWMMLVDNAPLELPQKKTEKLCVSDYSLVYFTYKCTYKCVYCMPSVWCLRHFKMKHQTPLSFIFINRCFFFFLLYQIHTHLYSEVSFYLICSYTELKSIAFILSSFNQLMVQLRFRFNDHMSIELKINNNKTERKKQNKKKYLTMKSTVQC